MIAAVVVLGYVIYYSISPKGLKECPDEKIINYMPGAPSSSYYIKNRERREIGDYNKSWVESNCTVPVQAVG